MPPHDKDLARVAAELGFPPEVVVDVERQIDEYVATYEQKFHEFWNDTHSNPHAAHEFNPALHPRDDLGRWGHGGGVHTLIKTKCIVNYAGKGFRAKVEVAIDRLPEWAANHIAQLASRAPKAAQITLVTSFKEAYLAGQFETDSGVEIAEKILHRPSLDAALIPIEPKTSPRDTLSHELGHSIDLMAVAPYALSNSTPFKAAYMADKGQSGQMGAYAFSNPAELAAELIGGFMGMDKDFRGQAPRATKVTEGFLRAHLGYGEMHAPEPSRKRTLRDRVAAHVCAEWSGDDIILRWGLVTETSAKDYERRLKRGDREFADWSKLAQR